MSSDDEIEAALIAALTPVAATLGACAIRREALVQPDCRHLAISGSDLHLDFYFTARLNEIELSLTIPAPDGHHRVSLGLVRQWLGDPVQAFMFNATSLEAACQRVADFSHRLIDRYRENPAAALAELDAIRQRQSDLWHAGQVREQAETAWAERDFAEAGRLYAEIADHLTAAETRRLAFARKQGQRAGGPSH